MNETEDYLTSTDEIEWISQPDTAQAQVLLRTFLTLTFELPLLHVPIMDEEGGFRFEKLLLGTLKVIRNFVVQISVYLGTEKFLYVFGASFSIFGQYYLY
jgi:hypothetical protein